MTIIPKTSDAKASIVLYPSMKPFMNAPSVYASTGDWIAPIGLMKAKTSNTSNKTMMAGDMIFPTRSTIFAGLSESHNVIPKKTSVKINKAIPMKSFGMNVAIPISNATAPVRGAAKNGPIVKYNNEVNTTA